MRFPYARGALVQMYREARARLGDVAEDSPYAHVVAAVLATLPPPGPRERAAALRLAAEGPPAEDVGLDPCSVTGGPLIPPSPRVAGDPR